MILNPIQLEQGTNTTFYQLQVPIPYPPGHHLLEGEHSWYGSVNCYVIADHRQKTLLLIDTGDKDEPGLGWQYLASQLDTVIAEHKGYRLDSLFISHTHPDHWGLLVPIMQHYGSQFSELTCYVHERAKPMFRAFDSWWTTEAKRLSSRFREIGMDPEFAKGVLQYQEEKERLRLEGLTPFLARIRYINANSPFHYGTLIALPGHQDRQLGFFASAGILSQHPILYAADAVLKKNGEMKTTIPFFKKTQSDDLSGLEATVQSIAHIAALAEQNEAMKIYSGHWDVIVDPLHSLPKLIAGYNVHAVLLQECSPSDISIRDFVERHWSQLFNSGKKSGANLVLGYEDTLGFFQLLEAHGILQKREGSDGVMYYTLQERNDEIVTQLFEAATGHEN